MRPADHRQGDGEQDDGTGNLEGRKRYPEEGEHRRAEEHAEQNRCKDDRAKQDGDGLTYACAGRIGGVHDEERHVADGICDGKKRRKKGNTEGGRIHVEHEPDYAMKVWKAFRRDAETAECLNPGNPSPVTVHQ